jgi:phospholipid/cholesterol/gamma-HCH transport system substrate-binding protein
MRSLELRVGLLIVVAAAILGAFIFVLGNFSIGKGYRLWVDFDFSGNLQAGAPVKVSGIKVGKVKDVLFLGGQLDEKSGRRVQVRVEVWVEDRVKEAIRKDAEFFVNTAGVLGEQYLEIAPGTWEHPPLGEDQIVVGVNPPRTDLIVARLYEFLDSTTHLLHDDKDLIRNLLANSADAVAQLDQLLKDNRQDLGVLIKNGGRFADEGAGLLKDLRAGLGDPRVLGRLVADLDGTLVSARGALDGLTPRASKFLDEGTRTLTLVSEARVERLLTLADGASAFLGRSDQLVANANGLLADLRAGKGTAGALLAREEVYADLKEMVRDLKRNPWKFLWKE